MLICDIDLKVAEAEDVIALITYKLLLNEMKTLNAAS
jgi:hypothetical protein